MRGYCYLMRRVGLVKIGHSANPAQRARTLSHTCGEPVSLVIVKASDAPRDFEQRLHRRFRALHVLGEWFTDDGTIEAALRKDGWSADVPEGILPTKPTAAIVIAQRLDAAGFRTKTTQAEILNEDPSAWGRYVKGTTSPSVDKVQKWLRLAFEADIEINMIQDFRGFRWDPS